KWSYINNMMRTEQIAILALQETHLDDDLLGDINGHYDKGLDIYNSPMPDHQRSSGGVAFVLWKALIVPEKLQTYEFMPGRALMMKLSW
ncbi:hypothetical protein BJV74DRAFT_717897, partial [Russula compacta]